MASEGTWERFTNNATRVIYYAQEEAKLQGTSVVGTEHLLVGLTCVQEGFAAHELKRHGVTLEKVRAEFTRQPCMPESVGDDPTRMILSPLAKKALEHSLQEYRKLVIDKRPMTVDTEHLLLGLLRVGVNCNGGRLLERMHVDLTGTYQSAYQSLGHADTTFKLPASWTRAINSLNTLARPLMQSLWGSSLILLIISLFAFHRLCTGDEISEYRSGDRNNPCA